MTLLRIFDGTKGTYKSCWLNLTNDEALAYAKQRLTKEAFVWWDSGPGSCEGADEIQIQFDEEGFQAKWNTGPDCVVVWYGRPGIKERKIHYRWVDDFVFTGWIMIRDGEGMQAEIDASWWIYSFTSRILEGTIVV